MVFFRKLRIALLAQNMEDTLQKQPSARASVNGRLPKWFSTEDVYRFEKCLDTSKYTVLVLGANGKTKCIVLSENPNSAWINYCDYVLYSCSPYSQFSDLEPILLEALKKTKAALELMRGIQLPEPCDLGLERY